jgi:hypothetical protein
MSVYIDAHPTIDLAWAAALGTVNAAKGGAVGNLVLTISAADVPDSAAVRARVDQALESADTWPISTVANTLFPAALYRPPAFSWSRNLTEEQVAELDDAAKAMFDAYGSMLDDIKRHPGNASGTYFSRMFTWPGREVGGVNQLESRIKYLRGKKNHHASDLAIGGEGEVAIEENIAFGLQEYASTDRRQRAFPCLVHINLSAVDGVLSLTAVYRNWFMITRGYGNLVGLSRVLSFIAQQTGLRVGEIVILAGNATAERESYGGKGGVDQLIADVVVAQQADAAAQAAA